MLRYKGLTFDCNKTRTFLNFGKKRKEWASYVRFIEKKKKKSSQSKYISFLLQLALGDSKWLLRAAKKVLFLSEGQTCIS